MHRIGERSARSYRTFQMLPRSVEHPSTESFVVPCGECLTDINDDVVHTALQCLQNIVSDGEKTDSDDALANAVLLDLQTSVIVNACSKAAPLMCHPINRYETPRLISSPRPQRNSVRSIRLHFSHQ